MEKNEIILKQIKENSNCLDLSFHGLDKSYLGVILGSVRQIKILNLSYNGLGVKGLKKL